MPSTIFCTMWMPLRSSMRLAKKISFLPLGRPNFACTSRPSSRSNSGTSMPFGITWIGSRSPIFACTSSARNWLHEVNTLAWLIASCSANVVNTRSIFGVS